MQTVLVFQPLAQPLESILDPKQLTDHGTDRKAQDDQHRIRTEDLPGIDLQHALHSAGDSDEQRADAAGFAQGILLLFFKEPAGEVSKDTASQDAGTIDDRS